jgi:hypothetical protein
MPRHTHDFVENYTGLVGFGLDRATDEATVRVYVQKLGDDALMERLLPRMADAELERVFDFVSDLLRRHLEEEEYHALFLKDPEGDEG